MNNLNNIQHIYLYMDDSGKISKFEDYAVFAGIVFTNSNEKSEFMNKYRAINKEIRCSYCNYSKESCSNECPEIKGINISNSDRRRLINLSSSFTTFGTVILNKNLKPGIINRTQSKGRFIEYSQRRIIKEIIKHFINTKVIDANKPVYLHINIDEMPTKSNGYYSLNEGLFEEFVNGIKNFDYGTTFPPLLFGGLSLQVIYKDSNKDCCIQMADIIANTIRRAFVVNNSWYSAINYLKKTIKIKVLLRLPN